MAKVSYANLKLKVNKEVKTFKFMEQEIEVLQYLPVEDKYSLIMMVLQMSDENGIYNPLKVDIYFHLYLVYMYTNLSFTDKQRENEIKIYDTLKGNDFFTDFFAVMNEDEYTELFNYIEELIQINVETRHSAVSLLKSFVEDLPKNAQLASDIVDNFNKEKFSEVVNFAKAANGGRNI